MSFLRNATSVVAVSVAVVPLGLLSSIVLARFLEPELLGFYSVIVNFAAITVLVSQLGWPSAVIYRLRRAGTSSSTVASVGLVATTIIASIAVGACLLAEPLVMSKLLDGAPMQAYRIGLVLLPSQLFGRFFVSLARGCDRFDLANAYRLAVAAGILTALAVVLILGEGALVGAISALATAHATAAFVLGFFVLRLTGLTAALEAGEFAASLRFGFKTWAQTIAGQVHEQIDLFMLAALLGEPEQVAFYAIAISVVNRVKIIPEAFSAALFPHVSGMAPDQAAQFAARACRNSTAIVWLTAIVLGAIAPLLIPLIYGAAYAESVRPILVLLPASALLTTYMLLSRYFMSVDRQQVTIATQVVSTAANVALNLMLIPMYGILGAAAASLCSYSLEAALIVLAFRRASGVGFSALFVLQRSDFAALRQRLDAWRARRSR